MRLREEYRAETVINRSRFIACCAPALTEEQARDYIERIRREFSDATHVCTAYMLGENNSIQRSSDNHEPSGTAGVPILESIKKSGLSDVCVCVVRYFGGVKLGAGGLIRAYSGSCASALADAPKVEDVPFDCYTVTYPYSMSGTLEGWLRRYTEIIDMEYEEQVTCTILTDKKDTADKIRDISRGSVEAVFIETVMMEKDV